MPYFFTFLARLGGVEPPLFKTRLSSAVSWQVSSHLSQIASSRDAAQEAARDLGKQARPAQEMCVLVCCVPCSQAAQEAARDLGKQAIYPPRSP